MMRVGESVLGPARLNFAFIATHARSAKFAWGRAAELLLYKSTRKATCSKVSGHRMSSSDGGMAVTDRVRARRNPGRLSQIC